MAKKKKLTKEQVAFFDTFAKNILANTLIIKMENEGQHVSPELQQQIIAAISISDVSLLSKAVGDKLLELVSFETLVEVEKFLNSPEARQAMIAAQQVGELVQEEIFVVLNEIFGETPANE